MKRFSLFSSLLLCLLFVLPSVFGQDNDKLYYMTAKHDFISFEAVNQDTILFLNRNFDGANRKYLKMPLKTVLADLYTAMPIRSFYPYYSPQRPDISGFVCFVYSKTELKQRIIDGLDICPLTISLMPSINNERQGEVYRTLCAMGKEQVFDWTPAIEKMLKDLPIQNVFRYDTKEETAQYLGINP